MLVRIDCVSLCFSDVKILQQGSKHPKLYNRDMRVEPTRLGHETSLTVIKVGSNLKDRYTPGQRLAMQPDIYQNGKSTAYGYTIPGGLVQYHLIGPEVLVTDEGECLLPVTREMGFASASLLEPWGCVLAAYTQRRRLSPKQGGILWIVGHSDDTTAYQFSAGLEAPAVIVLSDVPQSIYELVKQSKAKVIERNGLSLAGIPQLVEELSEGKGFDDIVMLDPRSAEWVSAIAKTISRRGTLNLVGTQALDGMAAADVGRLHYDYIAFLGNQGPDIAASYGEVRNRCELIRAGAAVFLGAGGPMGQMHVQRALEAADGPQVVVATEVNAERLKALQERLQPLADKNKRALYVVNPNQTSESLVDLVMRLTDGRGADDIVLCVPVPGLVNEATRLMSKNGMLVLFAGMPNGTLCPLDLSNVYLYNAQYTGTSGLTLKDQALVMSKTVSGDLSPELAVAAVGGMNEAKKGYEALIQGSYPGKIIIFPQLPDLPLMGLAELREKHPEIGDKLGVGDIWTIEAEKLLIETYWKPE
jgi:threonine dehydrogenase-like Zn-dependent dehydrogenase